jgi:hypothetical protein
MDQKSNVNQPQESSQPSSAFDKTITKRFFLGLAMGVLVFVLILFGLGAILTHFLWPPQEKLSKPVEYHN